MVTARESRIHVGMMYKSAFTNDWTWNWFCVILNEWIRVCPLILGWVLVEIIPV